MTKPIPTFGPDGGHLIDDSIANPDTSGVWLFGYSTGVLTAVVVAVVALLVHRWLSKRRLIAQVNRRALGAQP